MHRRMVRALFVISLIALAVVSSCPLRAADSPRNVVVFFQFQENTNGVEDAVKYIFNEMLGPNDQLIIQSPARVYGFSKATLAKPKSELIAMMQEKLRSDISRAAQDYKQVIKDLQVATNNIEANAGSTSQDVDSSMGGGQASTVDMRNLFMNYRQALNNLNVLRKVNEATLRQLAGAFRGQAGENHIVILFEREFRPIPNRETLNVLRDVPLFAFQSNELFSSDNLKEPFDTAALVEFFKQVPLTQHFIYITSKNSSTSGNQFENSGDVYGAFSKVAKATGGVCESLAEPKAGLKAVAKAWKEAK